jgi:hypothetical protein
MSDILRIDHNIGEHRDLIIGQPLGGSPPVGGVRGRGPRPERAGKQYGGQ